ncbi:MAG: adenylate/guanylate cyclase domain-containing protein [Verrucomicrobia bacterium]|nr:adenylate/guanylate cyclase domain-containing protein [Deltaproteobacteria bacterium]
MGYLRKFFRKPAVVIMLGTTVAFMLILGLRQGGTLEFLELGAYDWFIGMGSKVQLESRRITIFEISEKDIQAIGRWPLTDETIARALKMLLAGKPKAIGLDIYRDILVPPGSEELTRLFVANPEIIGVMTIGEKGVAPLSVIKSTNQAAFGDIIVDPGGIVRRGLLFLDDGQNSFTSLALKLASLYLEAEGITLQPDPENEQFVRLGGATIKPLNTDDGGYSKADARGYQFLLDYRDTGAPFRTYSLSSLLSGGVPAEAIAGKIILVGVNAQSVKDHFFTPLSRGLADDQHVPGVVLHGLIASQLLRLSLDGDTSINTPDEIHKVLWLFFWTFAGSLAGFSTRSAWRFAMVIIGGQLVLLAACWYAFQMHWWIPLAPPSLSFFIAAVGVMAYLTGLEKRERAMLMQIFSKHVSVEVAEMIWEQRDQFLDNGRPRSQNLTATVFFSDLRGFTTMSEKMEPQELIDWLNTYMESMAGLIMAHGGVVDSYSGDGIKADFGVPLPRKTEDEIRCDAMNAVACAVAMEKEMERLNALWSEKGHSGMGVRVGIFTGPVVGGLLGSSQRLKYTTIGDTVNIASRLESYDKDMGKDALCRILIGDSTLQCLGPHYKAEKIGEVGLKGKEQKITVHRVLGESPASTITQVQEVLNE